MILVHAYGNTKSLISTKSFNCAVATFGQEKMTARNKLHDKKKKKFPAKIGFVRTGGFCRGLGTRGGYLYYCFYPTANN